MSSSYSSNITYSSNGWALVPTEKDEPKEAPKKTLFTTQAVQTKDGWLGQIVVDGAIVRETTPWDNADDAIADVNAHVVKRFRKLLA